MPSHGTDQLGQRYAYDFMRIDRESEGWKFCRSTLRRYHLVGVRLDECYAWGQPIHAPFAGTVVTARDGWPERRRLHVATDLAVVLKNALMFNPRRTHGLTPVLGNHVVLKMATRTSTHCAHMPEADRCAFGRATQWSPAVCLLKSATRETPLRHTFTFS